MKQWENSKSIAWSKFNFPATSKAKGTYQNEKWDPIRTPSHHTPHDGKGPATFEKASEEIKRKVINRVKTNWTPS